MLSALAFGSADNTYLDLAYSGYQKTSSNNNYNHNYNKIVKSDWLSTALISALIG